MDNKCVVCGKEYTSKLNSKYCSKKCKAKAWKENKLKEDAMYFKKYYKKAEPKIKNCKICGTEFNGVGKGVLCEQCKLAKENKKNIIKKCKNCGVDIPSGVHGRTLYCSIKCRSEYQLINGRVNKNKEKIRECIICGKKFEYYATEKTCSKICWEESMKMIKKRARKKYKKIYGRSDKLKRFKGTKRDWTITLKKLYEKDNGICYICGQKCDFEDFKIVDGTVICGDMYPSIDHVIPASKGGTHTWDNVRLAHRKCNYVKNDDIVLVDDKGQLRIYL